MMPKRRILLTTARWTSARAILESLGKRGHEIFLIDSNPLAASFSSKYCTKSFVCPDVADKENYVNFALDVMKKEKIDLFIPISDLDTEYFSEIREEVERYTRLMLASKELIELARNKDKTYRFCQERGFAIPRTYFPSSLEEVKQFAEKLSFPCLAKFPKGTGNEGNVYFQKKEWLLGFYKNLVEKPLWPVIQEFVHGDVAGFSAVCDRGKVLTHFMLQIEYKHSTAAPAVAYSSTDPNLLAVSKRLIKELGWTGAINLDFIKGSNEEYKLMEINPRFGGSICLAYRFGIDLPFVIYCLAFGEPLPSYKTDYEDGRMLRSLFPTELVYCVKDRRHIPALFTNFFVSGSIIDINWDDPKLVLAMVRNSFIEMKEEFVGRFRMKLASLKSS